MDTIENHNPHWRQDLTVFSGYTGGKLSWWQKKARTMAGK
jgi:hypothetical protein